MKTFFSESSELEQLESTLRSAEHAGFGTLLILACDENQWETEQLHCALRTSTTPVFGGVFPQIAFHGRSYQKGFLMIGLSEACDFAIIKEMSDAEANYEEQPPAWTNWMLNLSLETRS